VDKDKEDLIKLQNLRTTAIGISNYSVLINIIKHLSVQLINTFWALSIAWHCFLGVDRQAEQQEEPIRRQKRKMQESMSRLVVLPKEKAV
jgi:hypothetical protein